MKEHLTTVTRKGQITVPAEIRRALGIKEGDKVAISVADPKTGEAALRPVRSVTEMTFGAFAGRSGPTDLHEMRQTFIDEVVDRAHRLPATEGGRKEEA